MKEFLEFPKIARLSRECTITEKIDGTNASIFIGEDGEFLTASRTRWITPEEDNYGFSRWAHEHKDELIKLGPGHHFGEWWGQGIQRRYGLDEKRFSLFNTKKWMSNPDRPLCCSVVPTLFEGMFTTYHATVALKELEVNGSAAHRGFLKPEGIIIWHHAARMYFKKTIDKDEEYNGKT